MKKGTFVLVLAMLVLSSGCESDKVHSNNARSSSEAIPRLDLNSPESTIEAWNRAWNEQRKDILDTIMLKGAPYNVSFSPLRTAKYEILRRDTLGKDFNRSRYVNGAINDVALEVREYFEDIKKGPTRMFFLMRETSSGWKIVEYSAFEDPENPTDPEE